MVFCFVQNCFFGQHKIWNIYLFCRAKREFFFQNLTLGYMTKTLNQIIFFPSTKIRIFFSATLGIRIFFLEKTHNPPFKLNGRSLMQLNQQTFSTGTWILSHLGLTHGWLVLILRKPKRWLSRGKSTNHIIHF